MAQAEMKAQRAKYPNGTVWQQYYGPWFDAVVAAGNHNPQQAISLLEGARPLDNRGLDTRKIRGDLYLAVGKPSLAEAEYRYVLDHRYHDPVSSDYPFAWLGLGRALAAEGNGDGAIDAYQHFFALWAHADPDATVLVQAKKEFADLQARLSQK
jgi:tetratricopeptide (TPR) repeat protein